MKIAFFWTSDFSRDIFVWIQYFKDVEICITVSQPDSPTWRKQEIFPTALKKASLEAGIICLQPEKVRKNEEFFQHLRSLELDFIVVVAYGKILPKEILEIPKYGTINIHGSLLPKYRGASPIQESLKNGDDETWLTIMLMSEGMDEGDILSQAKLKVDIIDNTKTIFQKFASLWPNLLYTTLKDYMDWKIFPVKQDEKKVTYCGKIEKENGLISFSQQTAKEIYQLFQAYFIWPGIYMFIEGKRIVIEDCFYLDEERSEDAGTFIQVSKREFGIVCKKGIFLLKQVKPEWKKSMDIVSFTNGNKQIVSYKFE